eukprot:SAG31_NODE_3541_length_4143_cov_2.731949_1_plen_213_part_00
MSTEGNEGCQPEGSDGYGCVCAGTLWYITSDGIERESEVFRHIGDAIWWSLVTFTTVGYGDLSPVTARGRVAAAVAMFVGIFFLAMPLAIIGGSFADAWERMDARADEILEAKRKQKQAHQTAHENPMLNIESERVGNTTANSKWREAHEGRISALANLERARLCIDEATELANGDGIVEHGAVSTQLSDMIIRLEKLIEQERPRSSGKDLA